MDKKKKKINKRTAIGIGIISVLVVALIIALFILSQGDESGKRFNGIPNKISEQQVQEVVKRIGAEVGNQQKVTGELKGATLYIRIDMNDDMNVDNARGAAEHAFNIIFEMLPKEKYFTSIEGAMAYNIEIKAFDNLEKANFIIQGIKSYKVDGISWQNLLVPVNEDAANGAQHNQDVQDQEKEKKTE